MAFATDRAPGSWLLAGPRRDQRIHYALGQGLAANLRPGREPGWTRWFREADPLIFALVLAAAYLAAGLPGPARDTQLVAQRLADRTQPRADIVMKSRA